MIKLQKYCDYQERCHQDVRSKLIECQIYGDTLEDIMTELIKDDFLNEERFARSFARGKFRMNGWGRIKIQIELKRRRISPYCLRKGMEEIDEDEYIKTLEKLILNKTKGKQGLDYSTKNKVFQHCYRKGFESEIISSIFKELKV